ncbi:MAG: CDP-diacylglycerol--glycerol-3-phosphate 3-phosphatidyltransferase [Candidatus Ozemobacter sibiricus]|uniref:CDP-diacylglycerol--glycerol-3-phosphate 3-phosphatidyltransferase n=1 Tax=Candidatus Ozemobacter sibiricus TaxID=2268124 RepID=A0A367ZL17_9BACT|nr:MAG: CDP-diacylglycerol--glycerol-3-phosphate 3-phosphatidyltransferase [Candidatus Ozemobacter sibiricus]
MTLATKLTFTRVAAIPVFLGCFLWNANEDLTGDWGKVVAAVVFIIAAITDYYDGAVARWYKEETTFGRFIDPIADKLLVSTALIAMVERRPLTFTPAWAAIIIIAREFAVTGLRMVCAPKGKIIDSTILGKWKTGLQLTAIITALVFIAFRVVLITYGYRDLEAAFAPWHGPIVTGLMWVAVAMTVYSGYDYLRQNWHLLDE